MTDLDPDTIDAKSIAQHALSVRLIDAKVVEEAPGKEYANYVVRVTSSAPSGASWKVVRRFREFHQLRSDLMRFHSQGAVDLPTLGGKTWPWVSTTSAEVVERRMQLLEKFLEVITSRVELFRTRVLREFLCVPSADDLMKAVFAVDYGHTDVLRYGDMAKPVLFAQNERGSVLIRVHAASLNPIDYKMREGKMKLVSPLQFPLVLGFDVSGVIEEVAEGCQRFAPGDEVYGRLQTPGALCEYVVCSESILSEKPSSLSHTEAAALPLVCLTALQALRNKAMLQEGERVFVAAGGGGVGSAGIQLAKALGASHVATTCSAAKVELVQRLVPDVEVVDYREVDDVVGALVGDGEHVDAERLYDVAFDTVGGSVSADCIKVLKEYKGRMVSVARVTGNALHERLEVNPLVCAAASVLETQTILRARIHNVPFHSLLCESNGGDLDEISAFVKRGELAPVVDRVYPLEKAIDAFEYLEQGHAAGKVVISISD